MRKVLFYTFIFLVIGAIGSRIISYYRLPEEDRQSFITFLRQDAKKKYEQIAHAPDALVIETQNQAAAYSQYVVARQIQYALALYYSEHERYPTSLDEIIMIDNNLSKYLRVEYRGRKTGYQLKLLDRNGKVLLEAAK